MLLALATGVQRRWNVIYVGRLGQLTFQLK
jgi:hypothetical protein